MELRIKCDAKVNLEGLINIVNVMCEINDYNVDNNSLSGSVNVKGNYIKDDLHATYDFNENVPFTVVFKNNIEKIEKIEVEDFIFNEIVNNGIECKFNIFISYEDIESFNEDESLEDKETVVGKVIEEELEEIEDNTLDDEKIKDAINKKYDELLEEILEKREDNFLEENDEIEDENWENDLDKQELDENDEKTENSVSELLEEKENNFNIKNSVSDVRSYFNNVSETYESYHVYYPKQEKELEEICNKEKISIDRIYKDKANKDFKDKKRIIIK